MAMEHTVWDVYTYVHIIQHYICILQVNIAFRVGGIIRDQKKQGAYSLKSFTPPPPETSARVNVTYPM